MKWFWLLCLMLAAWEDLRSRELPYKILWLGLIPGIVTMWTTDIREHLCAAAVGTVLLIISKMTRGAIGEGDGLFFLLTACYLGFLETATLFLAGLGISCVWSMVILIKWRFAGSDSTMDTVPFLTCALLPGIWLVCR